VHVADGYEPQEGDRVIDASAAIANTGSVVLRGDDAALRPLLGARRIVARLDPATLVRYPHELADRLGDRNALILTGTSRTADIEKNLVRGIHGAEELVVVLQPTSEGSTIQPSSESASAGTP
jgi:L-lactate utilization protein LutC